MHIDIIDRSQTSTTTTHIIATTRISTTTTKISTTTRVSLCALLCHQFCWYTFRYLLQQRLQQLLLVPRPRRLQSQLKRSGVNVLEMDIADPESALQEALALTAMIGTLSVYRFWVLWIVRPSLECLDRVCVHCSRLMLKVSSMKSSDISVL